MNRKVLGRVTVGGRTEPTRDMVDLGPVSTGVRDGSTGSTETTVCRAGTVRSTVKLSVLWDGKIRHSPGPDYTRTPSPSQPTLKTC